MSVYENLPYIQGSAIRLGRKRFLETTGPGRGELEVSGRQVTLEDQIFLEWEETGSETLFTPKGLALIFLPFLPPPSGTGLWEQMRSRG